MNEPTESQLLCTYAESQSEAAFAELVTRHVNFVYSAAVRMVRDPHLAEDVTQGVFIALAKSAGQLKNRQVLSGWLHRTARNIAAQTVRTIERRRVREQEAVAMNELLSTESDVSWEFIAPHLDAALSELSEPDRDALLLRYFERKSACDIARTLGISDEAAQKRVSRATGRLRESFTKRGIIVEAGGLVLLITANAVQAAPMGLAATISTAALLTGTAATTANVIAATKTIIMTTLQKTLITTTLAVLAGAGIYEARQAAQLSARNKSLQLAQGPLAEQNQQLQRERDDVRNQLAGLRDELEKVKNNNLQLLKLRGELTAMRAANDESARTQNDSRTAILKSWLAREVQLKQVVEQNADKRIPDLQLLSEQDWLNAARDARFDTDKDVRQALASLRNMAGNAFAVAASAAVSKYMEANNHQFPTDIAQLQSYFDTPMDTAILQRWQIVPQSDLPNQRFGDWMITQRAPVDQELDERWAIGPNGYGANSYTSSETASALTVLDPVLKAFAAANDGKEPTDPSQILPYLTTPEQQTAYQTILKRSSTNNAAR